MADAFVLWRTSEKGDAFSLFILLCTSGLKFYMRIFRSYLLSIDRCTIRSILVVYLAGDLLFWNKHVFLPKDVFLPQNANDRLRGRG